jgi:hypothetical protein
MEDEDDRYMSTLYLWRKENGKMKDSNVFRLGKLKMGKS